jgi:7,8-dihydropterin-6-yl-methyl-4-(beta-D-ribofuranosyl)aminobenzene 5'-phosphate synthase
MVPKGLSQNLKQEISARATLVEVTNPRAVGPGLWSTGSLESDAVPEQALMVKVAGGLAVITGCAHPGLDRVLEVAYGQGEVAAVIGGFHDFKRLDVLRDIGGIYPCHCTELKRELQKRLPRQALRCGVGTVIELE